MATTRRKARGRPAKSPQALKAARAARTHRRETAATRSRAEVKRAQNAAAKRAAARAKATPPSPTHEGAKTQSTPSQGALAVSVPCPACGALVGRTTDSITLTHDGLTVSCRACGIVTKLTPVAPEHETKVLPDLSNAFLDVTQPEKRAFLAAYCVTGSVTRAALAAGICRKTHTNWMHGDEEYAAAFAEAKETAADFLEDEARRRAVDGLVRYQFTKDGLPLHHPVTGQPYFEVEYSDTLLAMLLNGNRPEKFKRRTEVTGKDGGPIQTSTPASPRPLASLPDDELVALELAATKPAAELTPAERLALRLTEQLRAIAPPPTS